MGEIIEFEYRGLNIFDEISTVEIAIEPLTKRIHVLDTMQVVEPEYNFGKKRFQMSEGFQKMTEVLCTKRFQEIQDQSTEQWVNDMTWIFYGSKKSIIKMEQCEITEMPKATLANEIHRFDLFEKYMVRVL
ncbi:hypothetical protein D1B33_07155 [Lysinibacillus yapensis]|uniref:Uncharacterized protein n=1 Tax=Ureibacillus yapensis TaxID=2304605 RepID=A0A396SF38_9BACL|nr:hypothetical protein [Lysinibacillus yapensis]RHW38646.1 hypothetical protein D1B33_07155 [Lysinibacillus yapensis]